MTPATIKFEFTDDVAEKAAREGMMALARKLFTPSVFVLTAISGTIFALAALRRGHWFFIVLGGTQLVLVALMTFGWFGFLWWLPRATKRKLAYLEHRRVEVILSDAGLDVSYATSRMAMTWAEIKTVKELPSFWMLVFQSDSEMPIPRSAVPPEAEAQFRGRVAATTT